MYHHLVWRIKAGKEHTKDGNSEGVHMHIKIWKFSTQKD